MIREPEICFVCSMGPSFTGVPVRPRGDGSHAGFVCARHDDGEPRLRAVRGRDPDVLERRCLVGRFAPHMQRELEANAHKGAWFERELDELLFDVLYHAAKLALAVQAGDAEAVRELAADTANCAAFVADVLGELDTEPQAFGEVEVTGQELEGRYMAEWNGGARFGSRELKEHVSRWLRPLQPFLDQVVHSHGPEPVA